MFIDRWYIQCNYSVISLYFERYRYRTVWTFTSTVWDIIISRYDIYSCIIEDHFWKRVKVLRTKFFDMNKFKVFLLFVLVPHKSMWPNYGKGWKYQLWIRKKWWYFHPSLSNLNVHIGLWLYLSDFLWTKINISGTFNFYHYMETDFFFIFLLFLKKKS